MNDGTVIRKQVGRYQILDEIGEGAMANVYKAFDPEIDRAGAFKVLKKEWCVDEEYVSRFLREAKAAGGLSHPNIVTVYDVGQIDHSPYILMELVEGASLDKVLNSGPKLPIAKTISIGIQLAQALYYAHSKGIVHRDIKPQNTILLPGTDKIKITDFGIAHVSDAKDSGKTMVGTVLGTPQYMAPEQALGREVDGRCDLFSVGIMLYEMLTGQKPFPADSVVSLLIQITKEDPVPISQIAPDLPVGLQHIVEKLLKKDPNRRFQSGEELAKALERELRAIQEEEKERERQKYIPLRVRWTLLMAVIVAFVTIMSTVIIYNKQHEAMTNQLLGFGASMAKFIAMQSAVPVLSEDWIAIETFVDDAYKRQTFDYLVVVDYKGIIRGAIDHDLQGKKYLKREDVTTTGKSGVVSFSTISLPGEADVLEFDTPVLFQNKEVGRIYLGLSTSALENVANTSLWLMGILAVITVAAMVVVTYVLAHLITGPINILRESMEEITTGGSDCRISQTRKDEFGELFTVFNKMAASVQNSQKNDGASDSS